MAVLTAHKAPPPPSPVRRGAPRPAKGAAGAQQSPPTLPPRRKVSPARCSGRLGWHLDGPGRAAAVIAGPFLALSAAVGRAYRTAGGRPLAIPGRLHAPAAAGLPSDHERGGGGQLLSRRAPPGQEEPGVGIGGAPVEAAQHRGHPGIYQRGAPRGQLPRPGWARQGRDRRRGGGSEEERRPAFPRKAGRAAGGSRRRGALNRRCERDGTGWRCGILRATWGYRGGGSKRGGLLDANKAFAPGPGRAMPGWALD